MIILTIQLLIRTPLPDNWPLLFKVLKMLVTWLHTPSITTPRKSNVHLNGIEYNNHTPSHRHIIQSKLI